VPTFLRQSELRRRRQHSRENRQEV